MGIAGIAHYPAVLWAFDPAYIVGFLARYGWISVTIFGAIVLCVSGVEALYADLSHFGRAPIAMAWSAVVLPRAGFELSRTGRAGTRRSLDPAQSILPARAQRRALSRRCLSYRRHDHRIPGVDLGRLHAVEAGHQPRLYSEGSRRLYVAGTPRSDLRTVYQSGFGDRLHRGSSSGFRAPCDWPTPTDLAVAATMVVTSIAYFEVIRIKFGWSLCRPHCLPPFPF